MRWLALALLMLPAPALAVTCGPVPSSFPLTQTAVSSNFAALYACINAGVAPINGPTLTGTLTFANGFATAISVGTRSLAGDGWGEAILLRENSGGVITLQAHDGALYVTNTGRDAPSFGQTSLAVSAFTKKGVTAQRVLVGPENSGGIGYRMLRVGN